MFMLEELQLIVNIRIVFIYPRTREQLRQKPKIQILLTEGKKLDSV